VSDIAVEKDYARKQYRTNKAYPEFVRTVTQKSVWDQITNKSSHLAEFSGLEFDSRDPLVKAYERFLKQSELKKPYRSDSYQDMEQDLQPSDPYGPKFDSLDPFNPDPVFIDENDPSTGSALFDLNVSGGWCEDETETIVCTTSQPCYLIQITYMSSGGVTINGAESVSVPGLNSFELQLFVPDGYSGMVTLEAIMITFDGISGDSNDNVFESRLCCDCDNEDFKYSSGNPTTILRSDSVVIEVEGSCNGPLYGWEFLNDAASNGFSFGSINTINPTNTLITNSSACGSALIQVTDSGGCVVTGSVRCTESGQWEIICQDSSVNSADESSCCYLTGAPDSVNYYAFERALLTKTSGYQRQANDMAFGCGCSVGGGKNEEQCMEQLANCRWRDRCSGAPCNAWHCPGTECLTHPASIHTSLCQFQVILNNTHKVNPAFYLPDSCTPSGAPGFYKGTGISPCCEYRNTYYEWACPP
jgi:hypothetical protein